MNRPTYEDKMRLLESYIKVPRGVHDVQVLQAIKLDVIKASSKGTRPHGANPDNALYNTCMGLYRDFLKRHNSHLDMTGRKAKENSDAMRGIITFIINFAKSNDKPSNDESVEKGVAFIFDNWDRVNQFHRNRLKLPDIYKNIEEILPMIINGHDKKSTNQNALDQLELSLKRGK